MIFGRSFCPECKTQLKWYDLVPVLSFIFLCGHCRYCRKKISWQYPIVEILSGFVWLGVFYKDFTGGSQLFNVFYQIFILSVLLIIAVYDFKWQIIPNKIVYPAIVVALIYNLFRAVRFENFKIFAIPLFAALGAFLFFYLFFYFSKGKAMGMGDAKLAFLMGLFLSPLAVIAAIMSAFIIGAAFGIIMIGLGKKTLKSQIAFGPFLVIGVFIVFFFYNPFI